MNVGLIGLGVMGSRMAANLNSAGLLNRVYNRTPQRAQEFEERFGVTSSPTIRALVEGCDVVLTMLSDDGAVREVYAEIAPHVRKEMMVVDMSTIAPSTSIELAGSIKRGGAFMFDAPVVGNSSGLEKKEVSILVGGNEEKFNALRPVLQATAKEVVYVGINGAGLSLKLVHNLALASYIVALSEAAHFGLASGLGKDAIEKLFTSLSSIRSPNSALKVPKILNSDYTTTFSLKHMVKDLALIESEAARNHSPIPLASASLQLYRIAQQMGLGERDYIAVSELFRIRH